MKKKATKEKELPKEETTKRLVLGQKLLYKTDTLMDNPTVDKIHDSTATLSNNAIVSRIIYKDGSVSRVDTNMSVKIRVWDETAELEFNAFKARRNVSAQLKYIEHHINKISSPDIISVDLKLGKIISKFINIQ